MYVVRMQQGCTNNILIGHTCLRVIQCMRVKCQYKSYMNLSEKGFKMLKLKYDLVRNI